MPVVMIPVHFDRDPLERKASTLRSFVLRPFITNDFMTGVAALPGKDIPEHVQAFYHLFLSSKYSIQTTVNFICDFGKLILTDCS